jgi:hypothetical protein
MNKKRKILKVSEDTMNEIINMGGDFIKGGKKQFPGNSMIRTSTNMHKDDGLSWTTDDQRKSASQQGYAYFNYRGFSYGAGSVSETYLIEDDLNEEDIVNKKDDTGLIQKRNQRDLFIKSEPSIPSLEELSNNAYNVTPIQSQVMNLIKSINNTKKSENHNDIIAIVINKLLDSFDLKNLEPEHFEELKSYFNG